MERQGLVLEGGGTRGVFTAGILDYFMEMDLRFPYVIGVSAGACNALSYVANQKGRNRKCMIDCLEEDADYINVRKFLKEGQLFDMDLIFDQFPNDSIPFDYDTFFQYTGTCYLVTTNCLTGEPYYFEEKSDRERLMQGARASSSLPYADPIAYVDGIPMLDGGLSDPIPIRKALRDGVKKNVVILTRPPHYRKKVPKKQSRLNRRMYKDYPQLCESMDRRKSYYNHTMDLIERLAEKERIFVLQPQGEVISRMERKPAALRAFYEEGYAYAKEQYPRLMEWLSK